MNEVPAPVPPSAVGAGAQLHDALAPEDTGGAHQHPFFSVAIGASAGGVEALVRLFKGLDSNTGCAYLVVMHLAPDRASQLSSLLGRATAMPVVEASDGAPLQADHVYVIPPASYMQVVRGRIVVTPIETRPPDPMAVNQLMISLAADQRENVIGIILTGSDGDGAQGLKMIKSEGGMTIAQAPATAAYRAMPSNAIASGHVDQQLAIEDMPAAIITYTRSAASAARGGAREAQETGQLASIIHLIKRRLGLDFTDYKTPMLYRRIRRRVGLCRLPGLTEYLRHLDSDPHEVEVLAADFLIGVTEFFREPHAWEALDKSLLPSILQQAPDASELRVWVPACSTGEEAYSMAMVLIENAERAKRHINIQIFASDVDKRALDMGRRGRYTKSITHSVGSRRLSRFFRAEGGGYQVKKELRQVVTFAQQNLIADPPFSRMDIVSCRNLLIYMQPSLQRHVLQLLHFALRPGGYLLLGKSETASARDGLFTLVGAGGTILRRVGARHTSQIDFSLNARAASNASDDASPSPEPAPAAQRGPDDAARLPARDAPDPTPDGSGSASDQTPGATESVEAELARLKRELRTSVEDLESTNEELKVANEEAMSTNEELQSTNEELATSKEELESVNEELIAVNAQLELKVEELVTVNDDLGNLLASTSIPTLFLDSALKIKRYTPDATRLFQLLPGDLHRPLTDIASACDMAALVRDARQVLHDLSTLEAEVTLDNGDVFLRRTSPYRTRDDRIAGVVVTFADVTGLKAATAAIDRLAAVMRASQDAIVVHDDEGRILAWNRGSERLYGYSESEAVGQGIERLLPGPARAICAAEIARVRAGGAPRIVEVGEVARDGRRLHVSASMSLIDAGDGAGQAVAWIGRDISAQKAAESKLRESEKRFRSLADNAPVLIWMSDRQGVLDFVNRSFSAFIGLTARRMVGRKLVDFLDRDDTTALLAAIGKLKQSDARHSAELRLDTRFGGARWMNCTVMWRRDPTTGNEGLIGSMVDIHEQVNARAALEEAARRKDEFLAMLGHELRNPLVPIRNAAAVLHRAANDDPQLTWVHDVLVRQVGHVTRLVDDLLDISLITQGTLQLRLEPIDLRFTLQRAMEAVEPLFARKRHRFECTLPEEPVWVEGDSIRLVQVFDNLLTNAAKYTNDGGLVSLELLLEDDIAVVRVRDDGLGILPATLPRIFDLFVQDERSIDRSQGGLGIGLALVRRLLDMHGATVVARSEGAGRGAEFEVRLKRLPDSVARDRSPIAELDGAGGRVMIVEDDPEVGQSMVMLLRMYGYDVELADDLESALALARDFRPRAVLMDIGMPVHDGYEVVRRLRAMPEIANDVTYIGISGFGQPADSLRNAQAGFAHYLVKPVDPAELNRILADVMAREDPADPA